MENTISAGPIFSEAEVKTSPSESIGAVETSQQDWISSIKKVLGINYFIYFYGPGLSPGKYLYNPNNLGRIENEGLYTQDQVSIRWKFSQNLAFDLQFRFKLFFNNAQGASSFDRFRWETPRVGISGVLLKGKNWTLEGAVNTDLPYFFPSPFTGYAASKRAVLFTPGMFGAFKYEPENSRWSVFSVVSPRYFFYADKEAYDLQSISGGGEGGNKPELILMFQPTLNYRISPKTSLSLGSTLEYRKQVFSDWNFLRLSLQTNGNSKAWRLAALPLILGVTYQFSSQLSIFPYIGTYPIAAQRLDAKTGYRSTLLEVTSLGMWLRGVLF